jgi:hypothetical protein
MFQVYVPDVSFRSSLQVFHLNVAYVLHVYCNYFIWMLHIFAMIFKCFVSVSDACCKCFSCFVRMLQVFYLDVSKVEQDVAYVAM